jgi:putative ABC transport system permease protein
MTSGRSLFRSLRSQPAFFAAAGLTLALGVGVHAAVFALVHGVLVRPLPFPDEELLVFLQGYDRERGGEAVPMAPADFFDLREQLSNLSGLAAFTVGEMNVTLPEGTRRVAGGVVTAGFFETLGVKTLHGRLFRPEEFLPGSEPVVLLGEGLWKRYFGGDPAVVGRSLRISGKDFRVVGVVADEVSIGRPVELWTRLSIELAQAGRDASSRYLLAVGRLRPGVSLPGAQAELDVAAARLATEFPESHAMLSFRAEPLRERLVRNDRPKLLVLWGAVGFVFLLVCANAVFLYVVHLDRRQGELALRLVLGAGRGLVWRGLLAEILGLSLVSSLAGLAVAAGAIEALRRLRPESLPGLDRVALGPPAALFAVSLGLLVGLLLGLVAFFRLPARNLRDSLTAVGRHGRGGARSLRLQRGLVLLEVALALVLLDGAGLLLRSLQSLTAVDPGFDTSRLVTATVVFPSTQYPPGSPAVQDFLRQAVERLERLPGVERAASTIFPPLDGSAMERLVSVEGRDLPGSGWEAGEGFLVNTQAVSAGYFEALGLRFLRGGAFREGETTGAVVDRLFAERFLSGEDPLGQRLRVSSPLSSEPLRLEVLGVVESGRQIALDEDPVSTLYLPHALELMPFATFLARAATPAALSPGALGEALRELDPEVALDEPRPLEAALADSIREERTLARLLGASAVLALLLATVGIHGLLSLMVGGRVRELGIRLSLGATPGRIVRGVLANGLALTAVGLGAGAVAASFLTAKLADLLFQVEPTDPLTLGAVALVVTAASLGAAYLPARRAGRVDPAVSLRQE